MGDRHAAVDAKQEDKGAATVESGPGLAAVLGHTHPFTLGLVELLGGATLQLLLGIPIPSGEG